MGNYYIIAAASFLTMHAAFAFMLLLLCLASVAGLVAAVPQTLPLPPGLLTSKQFGTQSGESGAGLPAGSPKGALPVLANKTPESAIPAANYDEQLGESLTQNFITLVYNITALTQTDSYGYGPSYFVNGYMNGGWWYQAGLAYDWPYTAGGYNPGFNLLYEVWNPSESSVFPSQGGAGMLSLSGPVNSGDKVLVGIHYNNTTNEVSMYAFDWNTGSYAFISYAAHGTYFEGDTGSASTTQGYFTGPMTEWYHVSPYYGGEQVQNYSGGGFEFTSAWMWADEYNPTSNVSQFYSSTNSPVSFSPPAELQPFASHGAVEYGSAYEFVTGALPFSLTSASLNSETTDANLSSSVAFSLSVSGGAPPYTYAVYVDGTQVYTSQFSGGSLSAYAPIPGLAAGTRYYDIVVTDSEGNSVTTGTGQITVNPDPSVSGSLSQEKYDAGQNLTVYYTAAGGTPPYTISITVNGTVAQNGTVLRSLGAHVAYVKLVDSVGYVVKSSALEFVVNPDPSSKLSVARTTTDAGLTVEISNTVLNGTAPYSYAWYVNGAESSGTSSFGFSASQPGHYSLYSVVTDSAGYRVRSGNVSLVVNPDPVISSFSASAQSSNFFLLDTSANAAGSASLGTGPYTYEWYDNGVLVSNTTSPSYTYQFKHMGEHTLQLKVLDAAGYVVSSQTVAVDYTYNFLTIGLVAAVVAGVIGGGLAFWRRRKSKGEGSIEGGATTAQPPASQAPQSAAPAVKTEPSIAYCPECGHKLTGGNFCEKCGAKLSG